MLKGHTKIELTDVKTGKIQIVEKDNMFTNAVKEFLQPYCGNYSKLFNQDNNTGTASLYTSLISGLLLFDTEIPEDANTFFPPASAKMIGCANDDEASSVGDVYRGTYNASESEYSEEDKTLQLVFDFATSQANGTIKSICLTNRLGGFGNYGNDKHYSGDFLSVKSYVYDKRNFSPFFSLRNTFSTINFDGETEYMLAIDLKNQCQYRLIFVSETNIQIVKRKLPFRTVSVLNNSAELIETKDVTLSTAIPTSNIAYNYNNGNIYIISSNSNPIVPNGSIKVAQINLENPNSVTQYNIINLTEDSLQIKSLVSNGFLYAVGTSNKKAYRIQISNSANYEYLGVMTNGSYDYRPLGSVGGRVFFGKRLYDRSYAYCESEETIKEMPLRGYEDYTYDVNFSFCPDVNNNLLMYVSSNNIYYIGIFAFNDYLATINNISATTKTPAQTMKITYTIQEVENE